MGTVRVRSWSKGLWELQRRQHGVVTHEQLRELGMSAGAIRQRRENGRLHRLGTGVYAVGRPELGMKGRWMKATLQCGPHSLLSHRSAAALWGIRKPEPGPIEVIVPPHLARRRPGIRVRRIAAPPTARAVGEGLVGFGPDPRRWCYRRPIDNIPVTGPIVVLVDLAAQLPLGQVEAAVNEADHLDLVDPETLRASLDWLPYRPGRRRLCALLDRATCTLTTSELERRFLPLVREAGLPAPDTQQQLGRHRVDFHWEKLGLVVETDSLRYHRTAFKQDADKRRDNRNMRLGLATLRFTHGHVRYEPRYVRTELRTTAAALRAKFEGIRPS